MALSRFGKSCLVASLSLACMLASGCGTEAASSSTVDSYDEDTVQYADVSTQSEEGDSTSENGRDDGVTVLEGSGDTDDSAFEEANEAYAELAKDPAGSMEVVEFGETIVSTMGDWDGEFELTMKSATIYDSLEDAKSQADVGNVIREQAPEYIESPVLLVLEIKVTNINALSKDPEYTDMYLGTEYKLSEALSQMATFYGANEGTEGDQKLAYRYELAIGETKTLRIGYWVSGGTDFSSCYMILQKLQTDRPLFDLGLS